VTWLPGADGAAFFASLSAHGFAHPWHFSTAVFGLWAARRANSSTLEAPSRIPGVPPFRYRLGGSLAGGGLPPVGAAVVFSDLWFSGNNYTADTLPAWTRGALRLMLPPGTRTVLPRDAAPDALNVSADHWLCAARSVVLGEKMQIFTAPGDAHAWRRAAYAAAGLPAAARG